jgi:hypothetical protein
MTIQFVQPALRFPGRLGPVAYPCDKVLRNANVPEAFIARMMGSNTANQFGVKPICRQRWPYPSLQRGTP